MTTTNLGERTRSEGRAAVDGLAVAALLLSLAWIAGLGSILGIALGRMANRRRAERGVARSRLATAAIWVGVAGLLACAFAAVLVVASTTEPPS